jgi:hypothetical protein
MWLWRYGMHVAFVQPHATFSLAASHISHFSSHA